MKERGESLPPITSKEAAITHVEDFHILPGPNHFTKPQQAHERMHTFKEPMLPHHHQES